LKNNIKNKLKKNVYKTISRKSVLAAYESEFNRKKRVVLQANKTYQILTFIKNTFRELLLDQRFINILEREHLVTSPTSLAELFSEEKGANQPSVISTPETDSNIVELSLTQVLPTKKITLSVMRSKKFKRIINSIKEVGIIEPPKVYIDTNGKYLLLDGHLRVKALRALKKNRAQFLISKTKKMPAYKRDVRYISPILEHKKILSAIKRAVPEDKIAKGLDVAVSSIIRKRNLLNGVCDDAIRMLNDKEIAAGVLKLLKRMTVERQIEAASLMIETNIYTEVFAAALLVATRRSGLKRFHRHRVEGFNRTEMELMAAAMDDLQREYQKVKENYNKSTMSLTLIKGYLSSLFNNPKIVSYLLQQKPNVFEGLRDIVMMTHL
jgi:hypothetical protein